ncbi:FAD-binding oxidoreductase [Gordonia sp. ABSL1-1]|uniref:FAD-binding oxidoreductase n=1 Tax=Gordonia sp. ABSL1-1 TaxID=3053923 RepID=UPI002573B2AB|nr:FAD-binding oxidoreductase [Gordonia sp. ABSL1-1]MDL9936761.1 FAD-binding oxidoreductase [Gordonia sp. ABSL1-1]
MLSRLRDIVGDQHVLTDPDQTAGYLTDWTGRFTGVASAVVRPRTTAEVAAVMSLCAAECVPVCVQGGNTGLVGGSIPPSGPDVGAERGAAGPLLLSTTRMTDIGEVDTIGRCVGVQAGVTVEAVDAAAAAAGLAFGVDLAARASATAGGVVATNAGGIRMIRHGNTRAQILGIEAVLADGRILRRWSSLVKDNVGYDLPGLLAGSEGTLAVITGVLFRLVPALRETIVAVAGFDWVSDAIALIGTATDRGLTVEAAEIMTEAGVDLVHSHGHRRPLATPAPYLVLVEVSGTGDVEQAVVDLLAAAGIADAVLEPGPARALWSIRESHTESIARSTATPVVKLDVSVPIRALPQAFDDLSALAADDARPCRPILFGHVGDGNIHVNLLDVAEDDTRALTEKVFAIVTAHGGSISAEHGIGRAKTDWTHLGRSDVDLAVMRSVKDTFDPNGLLNPGVIFG